MEPKYPQLTIDELNALISSAVIYLNEEQRKIEGIDNRELIKLFYKIKYECQNTGALFFDIIPNYEIIKEGE